MRQQNEWVSLILKHEPLRARRITKGSICRPFPSCDFVPFVVMMFELTQYPADRAGIQAVIRRRNHCAMRRGSISLGALDSISRHNSDFRATFQFVKCRPEILLVGVHQIVTIRVHHFCPGSHEVFHKLLLRVRAPIDFGQCPQL